MIWLEIRVSQGHRFDSADEVKMADVIERALDLPARQVFCEAEENFMWCYVRLEQARVPAGRIRFYEMELERASRNQVGRAVDEINVVDEEVVRRRIPEAL